MQCCTMSQMVVTLFGLSRRWELVLLMALGIVVIYTLRVNLSVAAEKMKEEFNWTEDQKGLVLSSFYWGYTIGQLPASRLAQYFGAKRVYGVAVIVPTILNFLVPLSCQESVEIAMLLRAIMGLIQSVAFPSLYDFFSEWFPASERTIVVSLTFTGIYIGNILGFSISGVLVEKGANFGGKMIAGWESVFYVFGIIGLCWLPLWFFLAYDSPKTHPYISPEELSLILNGQEEKTEEREGGEGDEEEGEGGEEEEEGGSESDEDKNDERMKEIENDNDNNNNNNNNNKISSETDQILDERKSPVEEEGGEKGEEKGNDNEVRFIMEEQSKPLPLSLINPSSSASSSSSSSSSSKKQYKSSSSKKTKYSSKNTPPVITPIPTTILSPSHPLHMSLSLSQRVRHPITSHSSSSSSSSSSQYVPPSPRPLPSSPYSSPYPPTPPTTPTTPTTPTLSSSSSSNPLLSSPSYLVGFTSSHILQLDASTFTSSSKEQFFKSPLFSSSSSSKSDSPIQKPLLPTHTTTPTTTPDPTSSSSSSSSSVSNFPSSIHHNHPHHHHHHHHHIYTQEELIQGMPLSQFLWGPSSPKIWTIFFQAFLADWIALTLLSELPSFLTTQLHFPLSMAGILCMIPYACLFCATLFYGYLFGKLQLIYPTFWTTRRVRQVAQWISIGGASCCLVLCGYLTEQVWASYAMLILSQIFFAACNCGFTLCYLDLAPHYSSFLYSLGNFLSSASGIATPIIVSLFLNTWPGIAGWRADFLLTISLAFVSLIHFSIYQSSDLDPLLNNPILTTTTTNNNNNLDEKDKENNDHSMKKKENNNMTLEGENEEGRETIIEEVKNQNKNNKIDQKS